MKPKKEMIRKPILVRNVKIGNQINTMYEKWINNYFPSKVRKEVADPTSISSIKKQYNCTREQARNTIKFNQGVMS